MIRKSLQTLALLIAFCGSAQADSYEMVSVAFEGADEAIAQRPLSCEEARLTAWFERERERTDGNTVIESDDVSCKPEQLAEVTPADAD